MKIKVLCVMAAFAAAICSNSIPTNVKEAEVLNFLQSNHKIQPQKYQVQDFSYNTKNNQYTITLKQQHSRIKFSLLPINNTFKIVFFEQFKSFGFRSSRIEPIQYFEPKSPTFQNQNAIFMTPMKVYSFPSSNRFSLPQEQFFLSTGVLQQPNFVPSVIQIPQNSNNFIQNQYQSIGLPIQISFETNQPIQFQISQQLKTLLNQIKQMALMKGEIFDMKSNHENQQVELKNQSEQKGQIQISEVKVVEKPKKKLNNMGKLFETVKRLNPFKNIVNLAEQ